MFIEYPKSLYKTREDNKEAKDLAEEIALRKRGYKKHWAFPDDDNIVHILERKLSDSKEGSLLRSEVSEIQDSPQSIEPEPIKRKRGRPFKNS